jgi:glyoxylase I family protein
MKIEHFAINVGDPRAMADWYVKHCGMRIGLSLDEPPFTRFLVDSGDHVAIEIYSNPKDNVPDYAKQHPLRFHIAFVSADPVIDRKRLVAVGATFVEEIRLPDGTFVITLRDPWGVPLQLCRRGKAVVVSC